MLFTPEFSNQEMEAIEEVRSRLKNDVKPERYEDKTFFYRFLKGCDFNIDHAESMLRKHLEWRKKNKIDSLIADYKGNEVLDKYFALSVIGYSKKGCRVRYIPIGRIDTKGLKMAVKLQDYARHVFYLLESDIADLEKQSIKIGKKVDKITYICDFQDLSLYQATDRKMFEGFVTTTMAYQNNYPERLEAAFAINTSLYFSIGFTVIKTCLASSVLQKIRIFGTDGWKEELLKEIDENVLPAFLGGKKTDPDGNPMCSSFVKQGGKIPEKYYMRKSRRSLPDLPGVKKIILSRASFHEEIIPIKEPNSFLEWEFETKCRDIAFGIFLQERISDEEMMTELVPIQRIDTDEFSETGVYKCEKAGTYTILFDNTYSWLRSKEVYFKISVISPKDEEGQKFNNF